MVKTLLCASLLVTSCAGQAAKARAGGSGSGAELGTFYDRLITVGDVEHRYVVYVPPGDLMATPSEADGQKWPLVVFLNGRGECGTDGKRQAVVGLGDAIRAAPERWPFVVAFPQKPVKMTQWGDHDELVLDVLAATERDYGTDPERRFLTGLSQGGSGTWELGSKHVEMWTAVAPVCGYRLGGWSVRELKDTPIWAFHGDADPVVPVAQSRLLVGQVKKAGGDPLLTVYEGVKHNSWDRAYRESMLPEWLQLHASGESLGARYLVDREAVVSVDVRIHVPASAADRAGAIRFLKIEASAGSLAVVADGIDEQQEPTQLFAHEELVAGIVRDHGSPGVTIKPDWREHLASDAEQVVWQTLESLARAGALAVLTDPSTTSDPGRNGGSDRATRDAVRIELCLRGRRGTWRRHAILGPGNARHDRFVAAFSAISKRAASFAADSRK